MPKFLISERALSLRIFKKIRIYVFFLHLIEVNLGVVRECELDEDTAKQNCKKIEDAYRLKGLTNTEVDCLLCNSDGCNGAVQYGPIAVLIVLPAVIAKNLPFKFHFF